MSLNNNLIDLAGPTQDQRARATRRRRGLWRRRDTPVAADPSVAVEARHRRPTHPDDQPPGAMPRRPLPKRNRILDKWGWYEPRPEGAWSTTRQAEALNLATARRSGRFRGLLSGRNLMGQSMVSADPFELYADRRVSLSNINVAAIGDIGRGKSSGIKCSYCYRQLIRGRQVVVIDKKLQANRGEYSPIADTLGVTSLVFQTGGGGMRLNLLDPAISTDGHHAGASVDVVPAGQEQLLLAVLADTMDRPMDETEKAAVRVALKNVNARAAAEKRDPILIEVAQELLTPDGAEAEKIAAAVRAGEPIPEQYYRDLRDTHNERVLNMGDRGYFGPRWAARALEWGLEPGLAILRLVDGDLRGLVDGATSPEVIDALDHPFVHFDVCKLPESGPALRVVMTVINTWLANRLAARAAERKQTILIVEEGWHVATGSTGAVFQRNMKLSRGLGLSTVSAFHHISDLPTDSPARALMKEAGIVLLYGQDIDEDAQEVCDMYHLPPGTKDIIMSLPQGRCLVKIGSAEPILMEHIRSPREIVLTDTDAAVVGADS